MHRGNKRKTQTILNKLKRHAKNNCANHYDKNKCMITHHQLCVYSFKCDRVTGNICPYFIKSVAPSDPILFDEYLQYFPDDYPLKPKKEDRIKTYKCKECGEPFVKNSNRQIYCSPCAVERRRTQAQRRKQKQRRKP